MSRNSFLILALTLSLLCNVYLLFNQTDTTLQRSGSATQSVFPPSTNTTLDNQALPTPASAPPRQHMPDKPSVDNSAVIRQLIDGERYEEARVHLQRALKREPFSISLLHLEARLLKHTSVLSNVVLHYYAMLEMPLPLAAVKDVQHRLSSLVDDTITSLEQAHSWTALAIFVEPLYQYAPGNRQYTLALATAYAEQRKFSLMEDTLAALPINDPAKEQFSNQYDPDIASEPVPAPASNPIPAAFEDNATTVSLSAQGSHFLVPVVADTTPLSLLLDTGASQSAISTATYNRIRQQIDYLFLGNFTISTASGTSQAALIEVSKFRIGDNVLANVKMFVLPENANMHADGLLGMNILGQFAFFIDQRSNTLHLQKDH